MRRAGGESSSPSSPTKNERREEEEDEDHKIEKEEEEEEEEESIWTFRVIFLGSISSIFLFIINKFFLYQNAQCIMSMLSVAAAEYPLGLIMAKFMPRRRVYLKTIRMEFSLNPGPFDVREFVLISIFANAGAAYGGITTHSIQHYRS